jgi:hypothetical protein
MRCLSPSWRAREERRMRTQCNRDHITEGSQSTTLKYHACYYIAHGRRIDQRRTGESRRSCGLSMQGMTP